MDLGTLRDLDIIDCAVLKPLSNDLFSVESAAPQWLMTMVVGCFEPLAKITLESSPFLADFIVDARPIWNSRHADKLSSGLWAEKVSDCDMHFEALAIRTDEGSCYLIIQNVESRYQQQQNLLQNAREVLLEHDQVIGEHEYIKQRLNHFLTSAKDKHIDLPAIQQTFYHLETGVIVTNTTGAVMFENESAKILLNSTSHEDSAAKIQGIITELGLTGTRVKDLIKRRSSWQGEVFWHNYSANALWLQMTVHPVLDEVNCHVNWVYVFSEISSLKDEGSHLPPQISSDSLTTLPGRHYFTVQLRKTCALNKPFYLINVDIKGFKHINNLYGYRTGDEILKVVAHRLLQATGNAGFAARIASNEFALIIPAAQQGVEGDALIIVEALRLSLNQPYDTSQVQHVEIKVCAGVADYPRHGRSAEELMRNCGLALYYAKYNEEAGICQFSEALLKSSEARYQIEDELRQAIGAGDLEVYVQPIIDLNTNQVVKCEALTRWRNNEGNFVAPDVFIPVAEQSGLIIKLGNWLVTEVCLILNRFASLGIEAGVSINVSAMQVADVKNIDDILARIEEHGVATNKLSFELTESVLVNSYESVSKMLVKLRQLGIVVSIDDFGTGFSSLSYLKHLPIDELKIDKSFIQDLDAKGGDDNVIVMAIIALANSLGLRTVAEGVETDAQQAFLRQHQCDLVQGYFYSKPVPVEEFCQWYQQRG